MVTGPAGEEIWTDKYGRVKVQFHWDRAGQARREQLVLGPRLAGLGRHRLRRHPHPAHRPGGDRRVPGGRPRPADHHRPRLQRPGHAALRPAGQRHAVRHQEQLDQGRRRLQRAALRGQEGPGAGLPPRPEGRGRSSSRTTRPRTSATTRPSRSATTAPRPWATNETLTVGRGSDPQRRQQRDRVGRQQSDRHDRSEPRRRRRRQRDRARSA